VMTAHGSLPNISDRSRMTFMNGFAKAKACEDGVWPWYLKGGKVVERADAESLPYE